MALRAVGLAVRKHRMKLGLSPLICIFTYFYLSSRSSRASPGLCLQGRLLLAPGRSIQQRSSISK